MSSTGSVMIALQHMNREELCEAFCARLTDDSLRVAVGSNYDALTLFAHRNAALGLIAANHLPYPMVDSTTLQEIH